VLTLIPDFGDGFSLRTVDNPAGSAILSTSVVLNTTIVQLPCSQSQPAMPAYARRDIVDEDRVGVYHCIARCVRRAFLCGTDSYTGRDYSHRKAWVLDRLRQLAGLFGVEVCDYAVMSNHLHLVLRNRPDVARQWSDDEIAIRWRKLFPQRDELTGKPREPDNHDVALLTADADRLAILRSRLASLSWFMRCLCEWVARKANHEEGSFGRFWAGRFRSQPLLDESALLACSVYGRLRQKARCCFSRFTAGRAKNFGRTRWGVSGGRGDALEGVWPAKNAAALRK
jgi:hypothetical protein